MIKVIQLLKESFLTYRLNFKKIFWLVLPILVLGIIGEYYVSTFTTMIDNNYFGNISYLIISITIYVLAVLSISLFFGPVLNRAIQKNEDIGNFDSKASYIFQKKNFFKWIMLNIWGFLYAIWIMLPYIVTAILISIILYIFINSSIIALILSSLIVLTFLIGIVLNITKFILYKNIFFSKDEISARDAVRESIMFGKTKNNQVWKLILTLIVLSTVMMVTYFILDFMMGLLTKSISNSIASTTISILFFLPVTSILIAKGYNAIKV